MTHRAQAGPGRIVVSSMVAVASCSGATSAPLRSAPDRSASCRLAPKRIAWRSLDQIRAAEVGAGQVRPIRAVGAQSRGACRHWPAADPIGSPVKTRMPFRCTVEPMESLFQLPLAFWVTVGTTVLCGVIVGLERQLRGKAVGVRTSCLICLSTAVFVQLGASVATSSSDPTRVVGQIVTGVGFLGAGVMLAREGVVTGVTTAAVIWALAAIGSAIGLGYPAEAVVLSLVTVAILAGVGFLESRFRVLATGVHRKKGSRGHEQP